jgi:hypothetical protein
MDGRPAASCLDRGGVSRFRTRPIVHRDSCRLAVNLFGETGATLRFDDHPVELTSGNRKLVVKRVDAVPAEWRHREPPAEVETIAVVENKDLYTSLERCLAVTTDIDLTKRAPAVTIRWHADEGPDVSVCFGTSADSDGLCSGQ